MPMPVFFVDGHQIGDDEGAVELFLAAVQLLGVLDEGHRAGDALIAAAGVDDDRQLAAVHAGIGAGGGLGFCAVGDIVAVSGQQHPPDVGAVVAQQALFCNGVVVADLPFQQVCHVPQVGGLGKVQMSCMFSRLRSARASSCTVSSSRGTSYSTVPFFSMRQMLVW